jgi:hypothetical protein
MGLLNFCFKYQFKNIYANDNISKLQNTLQPPSSADCVNKRSSDEFICGQVWDHVHHIPTVTTTIILTN